MIVTETDRILGISPPTVSTTGVVLSACIICVQSTESARPDAASELCITAAILALAALELNVTPEISWKLALLARVAACRRAVCLHASGVFAIANVRMRIPGHDHAVFICARDIDNVLDVLASV